MGLEEPQGEVKPLGHLPRKIEETLTKKDVVMESLHIILIVIIVIMAAAMVFLALRQQEWHAAGCGQRR